MARARQVVFRIFYSTSFTIVFLILVSFICVTPADAIYQSYRRRRTLDIFLLSGAYVVTALIAILIYASRLYTNRSVLRDIPKTFMPIEKEELPGKRVYTLIQDCLAKSAVIAYQARPRSKRIEHESHVATTRLLTLCRSRECTDPHIEERWGNIDHPGWSSPAAKTTPNLEYATVIDELTDLIEAKAVSLAPVDPMTKPGPDGLPLPDPRVIEAISRPGTMGMRAYLRHLIEIGIITDDSLTVTFLSIYERARFSCEPLSQHEFQGLMRMFAEILRKMTPVDLDLLDLDESSSHDRSDSSSLASQNKEHGRHHKKDYRGNRASVPSTFSDSGSVRRNRAPPRRVSEDSVPSMSSYEREHGHHREMSPQHSDDGNISDDEHEATDDEEADRLSLRTAPTHTNRSISRPSLPGRNSSSRFFSADSSQGLGLQHARSHSSMRSSRSAASRRSKWSHSASSVIRLARPGEDHGLPYTIQGPGRE